MARMPAHAIKLVARDASGDHDLGTVVEFETEASVTASGPSPVDLGALPDGEIELGGELVPPGVADDLLGMFYGAFPWPQVVEVHYRDGAEAFSMVDANAMCAALFERGRREAQLEAELEQLRAEREPFRVLMDQALDAGLAVADPLRRAVNAGVLELAERLGFRKPELGPLTTGSTFLLDHLGDPVPARVANIRSPLKLPEGTQLVRIEVIGLGGRPRPEPTTVPGSGVRRSSP